MSDRLYPVWSKQWKTIIQQRWCDGKWLMTNDVTQKQNTSYHRLNVLYIYLFICIYYISIFNLWSYCILTKTQWNGSRSHTDKCRYSVVIRTEKMMCCCALRSYDIDIQGIQRLGGWVMLDVANFTVVCQYLSTCTQYQYCCSCSL